jgi:K+-transporting ATPase ATPase B chain
MIDLDSNPSKLFEIIQIGKQMLMTRGALMALSLGNDLSKYFVLLPALLIPVFPQFEELNFLHLNSPKNTILSAVIFNAVCLVMLIPLSFTGIKLIPEKVDVLLKKHLLIYGVGGILMPFLGIKVIDIFLSQWIIL